MNLTEDLFAPEFSIPNVENTAINFDLIMEPITPEHTEKPSTIERALEEVDKYLQSIGENGDDIWRANGDDKRRKNGEDIIN